MSNEFRVRHTRRYEEHDCPAPKPCPPCPPCPPRQEVKRVSSCSCGGACSKCKPKGENFSTWENIIWLLIMLFFLIGFLGGATR